MMFLSMFPLGMFQYYTAIGYGLWYARSSARIQGDVFLMSCDSSRDSVIRGDSGIRRTE